MLIVYEPVDALAGADLRGKEEDTLALAWEQRRWIRGKFTTTKGRQVALALPTGTPLVPGTVILIEEDWYLRAEAVPESLIAVTPRNHEEAIRLAFEIGNLHFPLALEDGALLVPDDAAMTHLFDRLKVPWTRRQSVFTPMGAGRTAQANSFSL
jgi:urease accessory protein UreE